MMSHFKYHIYSLKENLSDERRKTKIEKIKTKLKHQIIEGNLPCRTEINSEHSRMITIKTTAPRGDVEKYLKQETEYLDMEYELLSHFA